MPSEEEAANAVKQALGASASECDDHVLEYLGQTAAESTDLEAMVEAMGEMVCFIMIHYMVFLYVYGMFHMHILYVMFFICKYYPARGLRVGWGRQCCQGDLLVSMGPAPDRCGVLCCG